MENKPVKIMLGWADVGSNGGVFVFDGGPIYKAYGPLLHIWEKKISKDLVPVEIHIPQNEE